MSTSSLLCHSTFCWDQILYSPKSTHIYNFHSTWEKTNIYHTLNFLILLNKNYICISLIGISISNYTDCPRWPKQTWKAHKQYSKVHIAFILQYSLIGLLCKVKAIGFIWQNIILSSDCSNENNTLWVNNQRDYKVCFVFWVFFFF